MNIRERRTYLLGLSKDNRYFLCGALNASKATSPEEQAANLFSAGSWPWDGRAHLQCWCCSLNPFWEMSPRTHRLAPRTYSGLPLFPCVKKKTSSHKPRHFFINSKRRLTRAHTSDSQSFRCFLPFCPWRATARLRPKEQKSLENPRLSDAKQFCRSRNARRQGKGRREYFVYSQGL